MRINYSKSEVFTVGMSESDSEKVAGASAEKIEKRLQTWKCGHLSCGGRSILINSSLTSIPMYSMGFYCLYEGTHQRFDTCRSKFFLGRNGQ